MPPDAERIVELVDRYAPGLRALACKWSDNPDDLVQEALCRLVAQPRMPERPGPWLFQVVRNLAHDQIRRDRRRRARETRAARPETVETDPALRADAHAAAALLGRLKPDAYEIVVMRLWGGLTLQETAEACGVSVATAHRRYHAALEELGQWMKTHPPNPGPSDTSRSNRC